MKYWIFTGGEKNALFHQLMSDLEMLENVALIDKLPQIPEKYRKIWQLHHNEKLNRSGPLPLRNLWYSYMPLDEKVLQEGEHCLIFNNVSAPYFEPGLLKKWKMKYRLKLVFYFLDVYDSFYARHARAFIRQVPFDFVYSFYQEDVRKYHFKYLDCYYSKLDVSEEKYMEDGKRPAEGKVNSIDSGAADKRSGIQMDDSKSMNAIDSEAAAHKPKDEKNPIQEKKHQIFFWGTDGGRRPFIEAAAQRLADLGASGKFGICYTEEAEERRIIVPDMPETSKVEELTPATDDTNKSLKSLNSGSGIEIIYNQPMKYPEVVQAIQSSDIILDAAGDYSKGVSLRYFESFAYHKKLITNNPLVKKMRGYDPNRILVIDSPAEISKEFLEKELPRQEYENQFSPVHFIEELEKSW